MVLAAYLHILQTAAIPFLAACALERLLPAERRQPLRKLLFNVAYYLAVTPVVTFLWLPVARVAEGGKAALGHSLVPLHVGAGLGHDIVSGLVVVFVWDFLQYWAHRAMHAVPFLWEIHKLHHSDTALNASSAGRHHLGSHVFQSVVVGVPLILLVGQDGLTAAMAIVFFYAYGYFNHMNVRLSLGVLTPVLSGPQLHRLHHSSLQRHRDRNFAAFFPVLDVLFGTYLRPQRGEFPPTGLESGEEMNDVRSLTIAPLAGWLAALRLGRRSRAAAHAGGNPVGDDSIR